MRCMCCLDYVARKEYRLCHGCKGWYCPECHEDHKPCNRETGLKSEDETVDITQDDKSMIDDSKPGVWIVKLPESEHQKFDFWSYVA